MKKIRLSLAQARMLRMMQEGYVLSMMGCVVGHTGWTNYVRLEQRNYPNGVNKEARGSIATVKALVDRGLIEQTTNARMDSLNFYGLTKKGKEWVG